MLQMGSNFTRMHHVIYVEKDKAIFANTCTFTSTFSVHNTWDNIHSSRLIKSFLTFSN